MTSALVRSAICGLVLLALAAAGAPAGADEGPPFGTNRVSAAITDVDGEADVDDYVAPLLKGESLSVSVAATGKSKLHPTVQVFDPAGQDRTPALKVAKTARSASFSGLVAGTTGRWTVRVSGVDATQGAYSAAFKLKTATKFGTKKGELGNGAPRSATHTFEATPGSLVTMTLRPVGKGAVMEFAGSAEPTGTDYPPLTSDVTVKRGVSTVSRHVIVRGAGTYSVTVSSPDPTSLDPLTKYSLDIVVAPQPRAKGTKKFKAVEARLTALAAPQRIARGFEAVFAGRNLSVDPEPRVLLGVIEAQVTAVAPDGTSVTVLVPELPEPSVLDVIVVNPDGQAATRRGFVSVIAPPVVTDVIDASGTPARKAPVAGGDALRVVGNHFDEFSEVSFGDVAVPVDQVVDATKLAITSPQTARALVDVIVTDDFGRTARSSFKFLFPFPGWGEGDVGRFPKPSLADDFAGARAVAADLDRDGSADDVVLAAPLRSYAAGGVRHGPRDSETRVLVEGPDRSFTDGTSARLPAAFSQAFPFDTDDWNAEALAVGDLDGVKGGDVVLGGFAETYADGFATDTLYGSNRFAAGVRALRNDGAGKFALGTADQAKPQRLRPDMTAKDGNGADRPLFGPYGPDRGDPAALAIGDLDLDGDMDVVLARGEGGFRRVRQNVAKVDFTKDPPTIATADADQFVPSPYATYAYVAGTEILDNGGLATAGSLRYVTELRMPLSVGGYPVSYRGPDAPGFHGDDVALGDLDHDGDLDLVVAWHDPTTVSVKGRKSRLQDEFDGVSPPTSRDGPRVATRVLLNDGKGRFTDSTDTWMPAGAGPEFWQAHRIAVTDVDGDGWADLVLAHREGVEAWTATAFAAVTTTPTGTTVTPGTLAAGETDAFSFTLAAASRCSVEVSLGTLTDSVVRLYGPNSESLLVATNDDGGTDGGSRIVRSLSAGTWIAKVTGFSGADAGTYTLTVLARPDVAPPVSRARSALRVLLNDEVNHKFVDATASSIPAPPDGDDFRGGALRAADVDGDGRVDLLVATDEELTDSTQTRIRSLRLFLGGPGPAWTLRQDLLPSATLDCGQAEDIVLLPSPEGHEAPSFLLVNRRKPAASQGNRLTRLLDWNR